MGVINIGPLSSNLNVQDTASVDLTWDPTGDILSAVVLNAGVDHGGLAGLVDDDHTQYALLLGRSGGQSLIGGTASGNDLTLQSTSHATKGKIFLGNNSSNQVYLNESAGIFSIVSPVNISFKIISSFAGSSTGIVLQQATGSSKYNWLLSSQYNIDNGFEITPSTVTEGGTFSSPIFVVNQSGKVEIRGASSSLDLSAISAGNPNLKITATSDTPTVAFTGGGNAPTTAPAGYLEILVGANTRYIPFWA